jgi:hypothetical protein
MAQYNIGINTRKDGKAINFDYFPDGKSRSGKVSANGIDATVEELMLGILFLKKLRTMSPREHGYTIRRSKER